MIGALVVVRGGLSPVTPHLSAEDVRGRTQTFSWEPETLTRLRALRSGSISAILVDARAELAARHQEHVFARRLTELAARVDDSDEAREVLLDALDATVVDLHEVSRLEYERAEWAREHGGQP